jgi:hypothetical protein
MPERIQLSRRKGWRKPENTVVVARPSKWGNPFRVGDRVMVFSDLGWGGPTERELGPLLGGIATVENITDRAHAVALFRAWMRSRTTTALEKLDLAPLAGKNLACWCPLVDADGNPVPCHADVLLELANTEGTH